MDLQTGIVLAVAAFAGFWLARYLVRTFLRRGASGCGSCGSLTESRDPDGRERLPVHPDSR